MSRKISHLLKDGRNHLKSSNIATFNLDALILLQFCSGLTKEQIIFASDEIVDEKTANLFFKLINLRQKSIPVAKIIGKKEFFNDSFLVNCNVLDPRPDSEFLIEHVWQLLPDFDLKVNALEVGVGSGCLILSLLKIYRNMEAQAVDISEAALLVAKKNAKNLQLSNRLKLLKSDLFKNISKNCKFDLIISNPPYIPTKVIKNLGKDVNYDPIIALDGGFDGLEFYRRIAKDSYNYLSDEGFIVIEVGYDQFEMVKEIFVNNNFVFNSYLKDLAGIMRILSFKKQ